MDADNNSPLFPVLRGRRSLAFCVGLLLVALVMSSSFAVGEETNARSWSPVTTGTPTAVDEYSSQSSVVRMLGGLFLCIGVFGFGIHLYKRHVIPRTGADKRRLQVIERLPLSPKSALLLVRLDGREFLLTSGAEQSRLISLPREQDGVFAEALESACGEVGEFNAQ